MLSLRASALLIVIAAASCHPSPTPDDPQDPPSSPDTSDESPIALGEAADELAAGAACRAACWAAGALGCGIVGAACAEATTITIGGTTIPCIWAVVAACTASNTGASLCADACPH